MKIAHKAIQELHAAGYRMRVDDGGDELCPQRATEQEIINDLFAVDSANLIVYGDASERFVSFVFGNDGYDALSDYTASLEPVISKVNAYADELEEKGI